jgi:GNAT superfamily N-acetyltransferase
MIITALTVERIAAVRELMTLGAPYIRARDLSDYWLYASLFSSTCPLALNENGQVRGAAIALRSQDEPDDVYVQDLMVHPDARRGGIARALLAVVAERAAGWGCRRLYLSSEPDNTTAHAVWLSMGFSNLSGDRQVNGIEVINAFKGPGKDRAVYERKLT